MITTIEININALSGCWPLNVIAPTAAPIDISIRLASLISPGDPRLNAWGFIKADIATKTAAMPTRL